MKLSASKLITFLLAFTWLTSVIAAEKPRARIALLSDPHVNRSNKGDEANFRQRFDKVIAEVNAARVDFVLIAGDLTQGGEVEEMSDFRDEIKKLRAPVWFVPGNHDVGHKHNSGKSGEVTAERVAAYEKFFGPSFFLKERKGVRIIGINSPILGSGLPREKEMWDFLEAKLARRSKPTIVFSHYPAFTKSMDEAGGVYWNIEPEPRRRLLALFHQGGVQTMLTGHLHYHLVNRADSVLFLSTHPISFGLPRGKQPEGWTLVTLPKSGEAQFEFRYIGRTSSTSP